MGELHALVRLSHRLLHELLLRFLQCLCLLLPAHFLPFWLGNLIQSNASKSADIHHD
jgi:hypothetical protein